MPRVIIIAGPNGAGKTTFARQFLPHEAGVIQFVNADLIAAGISPFDPASANVSAGRVMIKRLEDLVNEGADFAVETTLSGRWLAGHLETWRSRGYTVTLYYVRLSSVEISLERIRQRVKNGGHTIPEDVARRRFNRSLALLESTYKHLVDHWSVWTNDGVTPIKIGEQYMATVVPSKHVDFPEELRLAEQAFRRAVRQAFLNGEAYDPDGSGKAYWLEHDEFGNPIDENITA